MIYPENCCDIAYHAKIPEEIPSADYSHETVKAFVTTRPTSFRSLVMAGINMESSWGESVNLGFINKSNEMI
jgi:hypothetical protein